jgi:hypothetical protein
MLLYIHFGNVFICSITFNGFSRIISIGVGIDYK